MLLEQFGEVIKQLILDYREDSEDFDEILELTEVLQSTRNLKRREHVPKTTAFFDIIWDLPDDQFRLVARMNRDSFVKLVVEIEHKWVFINCIKAQARVWKQLILVLNKFG